MKQIAVLFLLVVFVTACSDLKKSDQIDRVDQLCNSIDSIEVVLLSNEIDSLQKMQVLADSVIERISKNYKSDTVSLAFGKKMDAYKQMVLSLPIVIDDQITLNENISILRTSLLDLKDDIVAANGKRNQYNEYLSFESEKLDSVRIKAKEYMEMRNQLIAHFKQIHSEMYEYSIFLVEKNQKALINP